jgi:hypothetical protein
MQKDYLILRRASASRPSGEWNDDDFDVLADGEAVGRIFNANAAPVGSPWMWTLIFPHQEGRSPTHGCEATRMSRIIVLLAGVAVCNTSRVRSPAQLPNGRRCVPGRHRLSITPPSLR